MRQDEAKARETAEEIKDLQKKQNQDVDIEKIGYAHYSKKKILRSSDCKKARTKISNISIVLSNV